MAAPPSGAEGREGFGYCRLFPQTAAPLPNHDTLRALAEAMCHDGSATRARDDSRIPAGYTYLAHFLAHELTFDRTKGLPDGEINLAALSNQRSSRLELESIYGPPGDLGRQDRFLSDQVRLKLGMVEHRTGPRGDDLPRSADGQAIIVDERNDENLTTAQTVVALMKFHNAVADHMEEETGRPPNFDEVRQVVVEHLQSIILHDLTWRMVPDEVFHDVLTNGRKLFHPRGSPDAPLKIPVEFSFAAFRFGHSMVRSTYRWSDYRQNISLVQLFQQTGRNSTLGFEKLAADWLIDWRNFYDFSAILGCRSRKTINYTRKVDTSITAFLRDLPHGERAQGEPPNLAFRDLCRGCALRLPSGQEAARICYQDHGIYVGRLQGEDFGALQDAALYELLRRESLDRHTPLWFYILAEAEIEGVGEHLGRLGGRIMMEVIHAVIEKSSPSILSQKTWRPRLPSSSLNRFSMPDLLSFVEQREPIL